MNVIVALGLGLTLLATVALIQASVQAQVKDQLPERAPTFFFVDIQQNQYPAFEKMVAGFPTASDFNASPMLRGRIVKVAGVPAAKVQTEGNARGLLNGDRGVTYAATPPKGAHAGRRANGGPPDYRGPTLVSFSAQFAHDLHLKIGDARDHQHPRPRHRRPHLQSARRRFPDRRHQFLHGVFAGRRRQGAAYVSRHRARGARPRGRACSTPCRGAFPNVTVVRVREALAR